MIRALWYLLKICALAGFIVYLVSLPGVFDVSWNGYHIALDAGIAAVAAFFALLFVFVVSDAVARVSLWPERLARFRAYRNRSRGYQALVRSLTASAAGDSKLAYYQAYRAGQLLPKDEQALPLLLQAQSAPAQGDARQDSYRLLMKNSETALLGLQGLTQNAILAGDFSKALLLAREAFKTNPRNFTLLKSIYDLELKNQLWNDALVTLELAQKRKVIDRVVANLDRCALYMALGLMAREQGHVQDEGRCYHKALASRPYFVPAVIALCTYYIEHGERKKALHLVKAAWRREAHPQLLPVWRAVMPEMRQGHPSSGTFKWMAWVADFQPVALASKIGLAEAAIAEGLWGEAKQALMDAEKIRPVADIYKLWVVLEEQTTARPDVIRGFLDRAHSAPPMGVWVCQSTYQVFDAWVPFVVGTRQFNSLVWSEQSGVVSGSALVASPLLAVH